MSSKLSDRSQAEFNPYRCGNCGRAEQLKLCSGCRLISFCSVNCQKQAWKGKHQSFCRAISKILAKNPEKRTLFDVQAEKIELNELEGKEKLARVVISLIMKLPTLLQRNLNFEERLVSFTSFIL